MQQTTLYACAGFSRPCWQSLQTLLKKQRHTVRSPEPNFDTSFQFQMRDYAAGTSRRGGGGGGQAMRSSVLMNRNAACPDLTPFTKRLLLQLSPDHVAIKDCLEYVMFAGRCSSPTLQLPPPPTPPTPSQLTNAPPPPPPPSFTAYECPVASLGQDRVCPPTCHTHAKSVTLHAVAHRPLSRTETRSAARR